MTWQITQTESSFSGTLTMTDDHTQVRGTGTVSGTVSGANVEFSLLIPAGGFGGRFASCAADAAGRATVSGTSLNGTYAGTNSCSGAIASGRVTLTKQ